MCGLLQFIDGGRELVEQTIEVILRLFNQMLKDLLNKVISILNETVFELRAIEDNKLLWLLWLFVFDIIHDID